jgi:hypothetical protein
MSGRRPVDKVGAFHPDKHLSGINRALTKGQPQKLPTTKIVMGLRSRCGLCKRQYIGALTQHLKGCGR